MSDEQMQSLLDAWFRDTDVTPPDTRRTASRLMARVPKVRQRGRWLPFPLFRRTSPAPVVTDTPGRYQPSLVSAVNGHTPIAIGRTRLMLSPARFILVGALVFAIGGALLIDRPLGQPAEIAPAAEVGDYAVPVEFTAVMASLTQQASPTCETVRGMTECLGLVTSGRMSAASDPRLDGLILASMNQNQWPLQPFMDTVSLRISNDVGAWQGSFVGVREASGLSPATLVLVGEGAYEGLYAWMDVSDMPSVSGVIFGAPPPEVPAIPPTAGS